MSPWGELCALGTEFQLPDVSSLAPILHLTHWTDGLSSNRPGSFCLWVGPHMVFFARNALCPTSSCLWKPLPVWEAPTPSLLSSCPGSPAFNPSLSCTLMILISRLSLPKANLKSDIVNGSVFVIRDSGGPEIVCVCLYVCVHVWTHMHVAHSVSAMPIRQKRSHSKVLFQFERPPPPFPFTFCLLTERKPRPDSTEKIGALRPSSPTVLDHLSSHSFHFQDAAEPTTA